MGGSGGSGQEGGEAATGPAHPARPVLMARPAWRTRRATQTTTEPPYSLGSTAIAEDGDSEVEISTGFIFIPRRRVNMSASA